MKWLDNLEDGGEFLGTTNNGFNYNGAWGGAFQNGGSFPGSVGFSYARTGSTPSNGKYAKKTMASAQDGIIYDPEKNPEWKGVSEKIASARLANAMQSNSERAIKGNQKILEDIKSFNNSKNQYINDQKALVKNYTTGEEFIKDLSATVKNKYNFDLSQEDFAKMSPEQMVRQRTLEKTKAAIAGNTGYPIYNRPDLENTCMYGACSPASEAGVDYSALKGMIGVGENKAGKIIPQYNPTWIENDNYKKIGYEKLSEGESPMEGDFVQYYLDEDKIPDHFETITEMLPEGYKTFNNYKKTHNPIPGEGVAERKYVNPKTKQVTDASHVDYFRLRKDVAENIVKTDPQYKTVLDAYSKYQQSDEAKDIAKQRAFLEANKAKYEKAQKFLNSLEKNSTLANGGVVKDNNGYWNPDNWGKIVEIGSNNITMNGVNQPLIGVGKQSGIKKLMKPGKNYNFANDKQVIEYPLAKDGSQLTKLDQLTNWTNYNKPQKGGWLDSLK